jgi:hypothetical protein
VEKKDSHAIPGQSGDQLQKLLAADRIESGGRLVEQEHAGFFDERLGEADLLDHPRGERAKPPVGDGSQAEQLDQLLDATLARRSVEPEHGAEVSEN